MSGFFKDNPPATQVGSEDATESTIQEDAVTQTDTSGGFFQGSPDQTTTDAYTADALVSKNAAEAAKVAAEAARDSAASSASDASDSEAIVTSSQNAAAASATASAASAAISTTKASEASASESTSTTKAVESAASATSAANSSSSANTKAVEAATSAANSLTSENAAAASASTSSAQATNSATSAASSLTAKNSSEAAKVAAEAAETNAASSEANAASSATSASGSATTATTQAGISTTKASEASASAATATTKAAEATSARDDITGLTAATGAAGSSASYDSSTGVLTVPRGDTGATGLQGATGQQGQQGIQGETGAASTVAGPQGPQGQQGIQGLTGATGQAGSDGADSTVAGPTGPQGPAGADSTVAGPQGPAGADSTVAGPQGPAGADSTVAGPQGPAGVNGSPDTAAQVLAKIITVDGTGSGLDADLLDGLHGSSFLRSDTQATTSGSLVIAEDWNSGTYSSAFVIQGQYPSWETRGDASQPYGWLHHQDSTGHYTLYNIAGYTGNSWAQRYTFQKDGTFRNGGTSGHVYYHQGNDGSGSGLDADLLDGQQGSYYNQSQFTGSAFTSRNSGNPIAIDSVTSNMVGYVNSSSAAGYADGAGFSAAYSSSWVGQLFIDFRTGKLSTRGKNSGTWQSHRFMWDNLNDGSGSGLDADLLDGLQLNSTTRNNQANRVARTDGNGYANFGWINTTSGSTSTTAIDRVYSSYDGYLRYSSATNFVHRQGNSYHVFNTWLQGTDNHGLYTPNSGAGTHFYPAPTNAYGSWRTTGAKGGYAGISHSSGGGVVSCMVDSGGNGGDWNPASGWHYYYHRGNDCLGVSGSSTSGSYGLYEQSGGVYSTGNIVAYSDRRVKENIRTIDNALKTVEEMRGVYYNRIDDEEKKTVIGFIAQEVDEIEGAKPLVTYAEDVDQYGVSYGNTAALLVEAVKQLSQQVKDLQAEVKELKNA